MDYKKLAADLLSGCEENCANCEYAGDSEFECTIAQLAATAITDLLARAEAAEARAEKAEREIDAAIKTIFQWTGCPECKYWNSQDEWCEKHDIEADGKGGCSSPEWRGIKEE